MSEVYLDTSALVKRYLPERHSDRFEEFLIAEPALAISRLTAVELRCALARRRRSGSISGAQERKNLQEFQTDLEDRAFRMIPLSNVHAALAENLIAHLSAIPLCTLDALHLAIVLDAKCAWLATADKVMAKAATSLEIEVRRFF